MTSFLSKNNFNPVIIDTRQDLYYTESNTFLRSKFVITSRNESCYLNLSHYRLPLELSRFFGKLF